MKGFSLNEEMVIRCTYDLEVYLGCETPTGEWCANLQSADHLSMSEKLCIIVASEQLSQLSQVTIDTWFCSVRLAQ